MSESKAIEPDAWSSADLADPHHHPSKAAKVRRMFAAIAPSYDLNNRVHSLWRDQAWRRRAVREARVQAGDAVLDVACGTGDLTEAFARSPASRIVGLDFTREMLDIAERKRERLAADRRDRITYMQGDAQALPFDDASFDVVSIAFGIRNVERPETAIAEFARVLRPGGRVVILEFDRPAFGPMRWFCDVYCARLMPWSATLLSRDRSGAYRYLPRSVGSFMSRRAMLATLTEAGFGQSRAMSLTLGICACYVGEKSA
jgi:demethylmenaquinone methyltransferase/2-methoxy-6-polyprenyl-1,4-benzoquinol methylase